MSIVLTTSKNKEGKGGRKGREGRKTTDFVIFWILTLMLWARYDRQLIANFQKTIQFHLHINWFFKSITYQGNDTVHARMSLIRRIYWDDHDRYHPITILLKTTLKYLNMYFSKALKQNSDIKLGEMVLMQYYESIPFVLRAWNFC